MGGTKPKVLIVSMEKWPAIARLPKVLQQAGFEVGALCFQDSYIAATRYLDELFFLHSRRRGIRILRAVLETMNQWNPQLVIPGDGRAVRFIQRMILLHQDGKRTLSPKILEILRLSLGNFDWLAEATSKRLTLQRAQQLGLKTPRFACVNSVEEAVTAAKGLGWPVVVKKSTGWGGEGVAFCENEQQVADTYGKFSRVAGILKSRLIQLRGWSLGPGWIPVDRSVTVNEAVRGKPAMSAAAVATGKILAHVTAISEQCYPKPTSPSSVLRFTDHPGITQTVEKLIGHWGASGLVSFDFMLTEDGEAKLIECNPRPICLSYMEGSSGRDLCLALHHHFVGLEIPAPSAPCHEVAVHFPNEWRRDPQSPWLSNAYHDVPWDDPGLLEKLIKDYH